MEEYEEFYKKHLARLQAEAVEEPFASAQKSFSIIQFHGVAVLSPLLDFEKRQEMQQYREKAIELDASKQNRKKTALLNRVHEILENVQVKKVHPVSDVRVEKAEHTPDSRSMNGFAILPNIISLPTFTAQSGHSKFESSLEKVSDSTITRHKSAETLSVATIESSSPVQSDAFNTTVLEQREHGIIADSFVANDMSPLSDISNPNVHCVAHASSEEAPDPYLMSLQNLLKKSREYIEREQSRRSTRSNTQRRASDSNSDKENVIKISDSLKEKVRFIHRSRSCSPVAFDKPSLNKSNILLQGASTQIHSTSPTGLSSFSKADIPARSQTPTVDTESDEELKSNFTVDCECNVVKSLTGSYAKLPSPELCLSPKMHRRRPRTSSMGHIVINQPVNACDLSPMDQTKTMVGKALPIFPNNLNISEPVSNFTMNETGICINKGQVISKCTTQTFDVSNFARPSPLCTQEHSVLENDIVHVNAKKDMATLFAVSPLRDQLCSMPSKSCDFPVTVQSPETISLLTMNGVKPNSLPEKAKRSSPMELNKSYDVDSPSPVLLQCQNSQQQMDVPYGSEHLVDDSFDYLVKRRLDLDMDSAHKENNPYAAFGVQNSEQAKRWLHDQKSNIRAGSVNSNKSEALPNDSIDEDILKKKMFAFEEMRKRLEEQHAQQLSLLIAEQEKEQESLQKEMEEQERRLKDKKFDATDLPKAVEMRMSKGTGVDWKSRNETSMLEMRWTQVGMRYCEVENSSGSVSTTSQHSFLSPGDSSFYLSKSASNGTSAPHSRGRSKTRWSQALLGSLPHEDTDGEAIQVFSQGMQRKLNKVTALAKGYLTRRIMQTDKLKQLRKTVKDTAEFMKMFQTEVPLKRGAASASDAALQERVLAQLRAALYEIHDIFFVMEASERMTILLHDREVRREKMIRQMEKSPRERVSLSAATQKSLDRKKLLKAVEMGMPNKKMVLKPKMSETRILQPTQGQNTPVNKLLSRQGSICRKNPEKEAKCCDNLRRQHSLG